jgi:hypothetical protein
MGLLWITQFEGITVRFGMVSCCGDWGIILDDFEYVERKKYR